MTVGFGNSGAANGALDAAAVRAAASQIASHVHRTPVLTCRQLDALSGTRLWFKCENFQRGGAFKIRGATHAVLRLGTVSGVATHSSGNHAAALALAAAARKLPAWVVMPRDAPQVKRAAVADYGAEIIDCAPTLAARETTLAEVVQRTGAQFVHPYDDPAVIAGQGSCALELLEQVPELEVIVAPVGGGGLLAGTALAARERGVTVLAAEPARADDAWRSLAAGRIVPPENPDTIADGLRTALGRYTFPIIQRHVAAVIRVEEAAIVAAMRLLWERMKLVVEPSAAVTLAAVLGEPGRFAGRRVGLILSGGNVDLDRLPWQT